MTKQFCQKGDISLVVTFPGFSSCLCYNFDNLNFIILRLSGPGSVHHLKQSARSAGVRVSWSGIHIISNTLTLSQSPSRPESRVRPTSCRRLDSPADRRPLATASHDARASPAQASESVSFGGPGLESESGSEPWHAGSLPVMVSLDLS